MNRSVYLTLGIGKIIDAAWYNILLLISKLMWMYSYSILTRYDHVRKKRARGWFEAKTHSTNTTQYVFIIISEYIISTIAHARQVCILKVFSDSVGRRVKWRRALLHIVVSELQCTLENKECSPGWFYDGSTTKQRNTVI